MKFKLLLIGLLTSLNVQSQDLGQIKELARKVVGTYDLVEIEPTQLCPKTVSYVYEEGTKTFYLIDTDRGSGYRGSDALMRFKTKEIGQRLSTSHGGFLGRKYVRKTLIRGSNFYFYQTAGRVGYFVPNALASLSLLGAVETFSNFQFIKVTNTRITGGEYEPAKVTTETCNYEWDGHKRTDFIHYYLK